MRGEFIGVWSETWREIWLPLIDHEDVAEDIFCELYRELARALIETCINALQLVRCAAVQHDGWCWSDHGCASRNG